MNYLELQKLMIFLPLLGMMEMIKLLLNLKFLGLKAIFLNIFMINILLILRVIFLYKKDQLNFLRMDPTIFLQLENLLLK